MVAAPIRVLHIVGVMNRGGAETFIMNVYRKLNRSHVQFDFAVHTSRRGHYDAEIEALGGRIFSIPEPSAAGFRTYKRALSAVLSHSGPFAAIHSHVFLFSGFVVYVAATCGIPVRITHAHTSVDLRKGNNVARRLYHQLMARLIKRYATHMLGCSRPACEALYGEHCWQDRRVVVVQNGIDVDQFADVPLPIQQLRRQLNLPKNGLLVGHVGNFNPVKNHKFLLEVFRQLSIQRSDAHLVLVGDGPLRREIEASIQRYGLTGRVHLLGVRRDVPRLMAAFDVLVLPSLLEGLSIAAIEAQAVGLPSVLSDAVPQDADLELGLICRLSLETGFQAWVDSIIAAAQLARPDWSVRRQALIVHGYDAQAVACQLREIYGC